MPPLVLQPYDPHIRIQAGDRKGLYAIQAGVCLDVGLVGCEDIEIVTSRHQGGFRKDQLAIKGIGLHFEERDSVGGAAGAVDDCSVISHDDDTNSR